MVIVQDHSESVDCRNTVTRDEFVLVDPGESATVDIVFVPTLGESRLRGWTTQSNEGGDVVWPERFLKADIPNARILVFAYDESTGLVDYAAHADHLCEQLKERRTGDASRRPIVLVAHGLGGLVTAQVILRGDASVADCVQGLALFGTPFKGSRGRCLYEVLDGIASFYGIRNDSLADGTELLEEFATALSFTHASLKLVTFCELGQSAKVIVDKEAAKVRDHAAVYIPGDHRDICRFKCREGLYEVVVEELRRIVEVETSDTAATGDSGASDIREDSTFIRRHDVGSSIFIGRILHGGMHTNNRGLIHYGGHTTTHHYFQD